MLELVGVSEMEAVLMVPWEVNKKVNFLGGHFGRRISMLFVQIVF